MTTIEGEIMKNKRDGKPKARFFMSLPLPIYHALKEAGDQNYCTMTTYIIRALMFSFARDGIKCEAEVIPEDRSLENS